MMASNDKSDNSLSISWCNTPRAHLLNPSNIIDYFADRSNPFYEATCNNEIVRMQRANPDQLQNMVGLEYILLHVQEPILYVIRKQHRHSPQQVTPYADYYIIDGVVYQAPDLGSVINSRLLNTVFSLQSAFEEAQSFSKYHPSKGYWWEFKDHEDPAKTKPKEKKQKGELSSFFQRQRVDLLLGELSKKFPPKFLAPNQPEKSAEDIKTEVKVEVKQERPEEKGVNSAIKPPPEKKAKVIR